MARKPNTPPSERQHLVTLPNLGWNHALLVPSALLSALDDILGKCTIVEKKYLEGGAYLITSKGEVGMDTSMANPATHTFASYEDRERASEFVDYYNATYKLMGGKGRQLCCTFDEWKAQGNSVTKEEEEEA